MHDVINKYSILSLTKVMFEVKELVLSVTKKVSTPNFVLGASKSALEKNYCPLHLHYGSLNCCRDICKPFVVIQVDLVLGY